MPNNRRIDTYLQPLLPTQSVGGGLERLSYFSCSASVYAATPSLLCLDDAMTFPATKALASVVVLTLECSALQDIRDNFRRLFDGTYDMHSFMNQLTSVQF